MPFVLGMLAEAFPNVRTPNRAYVKYYSAVLLYMVFSYWTEPVDSKGWMEAYSIRCVVFESRMPPPLLPVILPCTLHGGVP